MNSFNYENYVKNLPDYYKKTTDSNNFKILEVERYSISTFKNDIEDVNTSLDLSQAYGKTLDYYGETVGQPRGLATDEQYILMIRSKIAQNVSGGDYKSVTKAICMTFDCEPSEVYIAEKEDPCVVELVVMPLAVINKAGLTTRQTVELVKQLLPVGVALESFLFEGTFCFSETETEYDTEAGFAISETDQSIGGYLGIVYGEDDEPELPIGDGLTTKNLFRRERF